MDQGRGTKVSLLERRHALRQGDHESAVSVSVLFQKRWKRSFDFILKRVGSHEQFILES